MSVRSFVFFAAIGLFAAPAHTLAQQSEAPRVRLSGFWAGGGLGGASTGVSCTLCDGRDTGLSGFLSAGFTLSPRLRLGAEANAWFDGQDDVDQRLALFGASLYWAPNPERPWYLKGGLGLVRYHAGTDDPDDEGLNAGALGLQLGGGYDLRFSRRLWLTPFANVIASTSTEMTSGTAVVTDVSFTMLQLGAGITYR
jgi:hypothetical protein